MPDLVAGYFPGLDEGVEVTPLKLGWIVGFLEGEGSFLAVRSRQGSISLRVVAPQAQREPLERCARILGGYVYYRSKPLNPKWKPVLFWYVHGPRAAGIMMTLYILMSPRRQEQIRRALAPWRAREVWNGHRSRCPSGHIYDDENTAIYFDRKGRRMRVCRQCKRAASRRTKHFMWKQKRWTRCLGELAGMS